MNRRKFVSSIAASAFFSKLPFDSAQPLASADQNPTPGTEHAALAQAENSVWPRPVIVPLPISAGSANVVDLGGTWKFTTTPSADFWRDAADSAGWADVEVPGELVSQGFDIARDVEYPYQRSIPIPDLPPGGRVLLHFDGVYSYARVWVNGQFVRDHHGGFTSWDCDITDLVRPEEAARLTGGVTDRSDDISYAGNYAKHYVGGILRGVKLLILPRDYVSRFHVETNFDKSYKNARLRVTIAMAFHGGEGGTVKLRLNDPSGKPVTLQQDTADLTPTRPRATLEIPVRSASRWDAEHPHLYQLEAELVAGGSVTEKLAKKFGFRKVERRGNQLCVNGDPVKLRGVCRHDVHPLRGRCSTPELDEQDARLLRDANVNFVRTSHYPPSEAFLEACDRYGIYVEEETAVCFVDQEWALAAHSESEPSFTPRYLNQFAEMIERDRSHPCVIFWSMGNESRWGMNFQKERAYVSQEDPTRPVIFSYPATVPKGQSGYDLYSEHYPKFDANLSSQDIPKLNDEYAHVSCYNLETLRRDPGVRNFWGNGFKRFWENCYKSPGCLGGAIWAGFDEVFLLPDGTVGYGEWGIVDGWRRPKPEYFLTRKAYSPVRIAAAAIANSGAGKPLMIPIQNWFNHTNFRELKILWRVGDATGEVAPLDLAPGGRGVLQISSGVWRAGQALNLRFLRPGDILVDEFDLAMGETRPIFRSVQGPAPSVADRPDSLVVQGADFTLTFSKVTGLLASGMFKGRKILVGGPHLNLGALALPPWWPSAISYSTTADEVVVRLAGGYMARRGEEPGRVSAEFEIRLDGSGLITTEYTLHDAPKGASEVGIAYTLAPEIDRLAWVRKALWSAYPADHIGRPRGKAHRESNSDATAYRQEPKQVWSLDSKDFFLYGSADPGGRGTNDFRSLKENICRASLFLAGTNLAVRVESNGDAAVRAEVLAERTVRLSVANQWGYPDLDWGNYTQPFTLKAGYKNAVRMRLTEEEA